MKILIVEDDYASITFMKHFLSRYGNCQLVNNGLEAIDEFEDSLEKNDLFDLVCLDIIMPKLDGISTLKAIREAEERYGISTKRKSKIIMTTALNDSNSVAEAFENGCDTYIWKPINIEDFILKMKDLKLIG